MSRVSRSCLALCLIGVAAALSGCTSGSGGGGGGGNDVTATAGKGKITIEWNDVSGAESYNLYFANSEDGVDAASALTISDSITGVTSPHEHDFLIYGETYYYVVKSVNSAGSESTVGSADATPERLPLDEIEFAGPEFETCVTTSTEAGNENAGATFADEILTLNYINYGDLTCDSTTDESADGMQHLTSLTEAHIVGNGSLGIISVEPFSTQLLLTELTLSSHRIADVGPLANLVSLEVVQLGNNLITTGVATLTALTGLTSIDLDQNPDMPCDDLQTLLDAFPDATILPSATDPGTNCAE